MTQCVLQFYGHQCIVTTTMVDVVPLCCIGRYCTLLADVVANCDGVWQMVRHRGRCYNLCAKQSCRCYCHGGRWNGDLMVCYFI